MFFVQAFSISILFMFLFFREEKAVEERQKFSAIWTVHKSRCFSTQPRDRFGTKIKLKLFTRLII